MKQIWILFVLIGLAMTGCTTQSEVKNDAADNEKVKTFRTLDVDSEWTQNPFVWFRAGSTINVNCRAVNRRGIFFGL